MGLFSLVVYGVGDMVGSGIYGTVGDAAGTTGQRRVAGVRRVDGRGGSHRPVLRLPGIALSARRRRRVRHAARLPFAVSFLLDRPDGYRLRPDVDGHFHQRLHQNDVGVDRRATRRRNEELAMVRRRIVVPRCIDVCQSLGHSPIDVDEYRLHVRRSRRPDVHHRRRRAILGQRQLPGNARAQRSTTLAECSTTDWACR